MRSIGVDVKRVVMIRLNPGDDILEGLTTALATEGIRNAMIVNGLGSTRSNHYHVVTSNDLPPEEAFTKGGAPRDIVSMSGLVIEGRVHAHISLSDDSNAEGGHLEPGTVALTFAIVTIADLGDADFTDWDSIKKLD